MTSITNQIYYPFCIYKLPSWRMVSVKTERRKINFLGYCKGESTSHLFVTVLNFIFTPFIQINFFIKKFPCLGKTFC